MGAMDGPAHPGLDVLFRELNDMMERELQAARSAFGHAGTKGDASETVWRDLLTKYLPGRYKIEKAHAVDHEGTFSEQLDVAILDRQYCPLVFKHGEQLIIPAESIYAVFEAKQEANATNIAAAMRKVASVRRLKRTSLPIPTANGPARAVEPKRILGGFLGLGSRWKPEMGEPLMKALKSDEFSDGRLDLGCVASHGLFMLNAEGSYEVTLNKRPATGFLLEAIARLQEIGTVPMMDTRAYARWLLDEATLVSTGGTNGGHPATSPSGRAA